MNTKLRNTLQLVGLCSSLVLASACADDLGGDYPDLREPANGNEGVDPTTLPPPIIVDPGDNTGTPAGPAIFASDQEAAQNLMVSGDSLYWVDLKGDTPQLRWVHRDGGDWESLRDLDSLPFSAASDSDGLYLAASSEQQILFADLVGLEPQALHSSLTDPLAIALDDDYAYWTSANGCVNRGAKEGGDAESVSCDGGAGPISLALTRDFVFWATTDGDLFRAPKGVDMPAEKIASGESFPAGIIADESRLFWLNDETRQVRTLDHTSGLIDVLADAQYRPAGLTQDRFFLYFTTQGDGGIKALSKLVGSPKVLATQQNEPGEIVVADEFIYWINEGSGEVMRLVN